jgi:hypothetical protein
MKSCNEGFSRFGMKARLDELFDLSCLRDFIDSTSDSVLSDMYTAISLSKVFTLSCLYFAQSFIV